MSKEQALAEAEAFIRRAVARSSGKVSEKEIKEAAIRVVRDLPPEPLAFAL